MALKDEYPFLQEQDRVLRMAEIYRPDEDGIPYASFRKAVRALDPTAIKAHILAIDDPQVMLQMIYQPDKHSLFSALRIMLEQAQHCDEDKLVNFESLLQLLLLSCKPLPNMSEEFNEVLHYHLLAGLDQYGVSVVLNALLFDRDGNVLPNINTQLIKRYIAFVSNLAVNQVCTFIELFLVTPGNSNERPSEFNWDLNVFDRDQSKWMKHTKFCGLLRGVNASDRSYLQWLLDLYLEEARKRSTRPQNITTNMHGYSKEDYMYMLEAIFDMREVYGDLGKSFFEKLQAFLEDAPTLKRSLAHAMLLKDSSFQNYFKSQDALHTQGQFNPKRRKNTDDGDKLGIKTRMEFN